MKIVGFQSPRCQLLYFRNGIPIIHEEYERFTREKEPFGDGLEMVF